MRKYIQITGAVVCLVAVIGVVAWAQDSTPPADWDYDGYLNASLSGSDWEILWQKEVAFSGFVDRLIPDDFCVGAIRFKVIAEQADHPSCQGGSPDPDCPMVEDWAYGYYATSKVGLTTGGDDDDDDDDTENEGFDCSEFAESFLAPNEALNRPGLLFLHGNNAATREGGSIGSAVFQAWIASREESEAFALAVSAPGQGFDCASNNIQVCPGCCPICCLNGGGPGCVTPGPDADAAECQAGYEATGSTYYEDQISVGDPMWGASERWSAGISRGISNGLERSGRLS
ncbi:MAG: hypothetical protein M5R36_28995 [Deltaproteobacteria bacterium]|nr:hypothetical protein [Deltaproteobacteria bacterium]